jgi:putative membrane protein
VIFLAGGSTKQGNCGFAERSFAALVDRRRREGGNVMRNKSLLLIAAATVALAGCGRGDDRAANDVNIATDGNVTVGNEMAAPAPAAAPTTAQPFVNAAAASDRFEIESSRMVVASGQSAATKKFAQQMIDAHTASTAKLKTTLSGMPPPLTPDDTLNADQQRLLDGLKGKTGADLDTAYAAAQVTAHQATLDALNAYAASGDNETLKTFASGMVPTVTAHLNTAKGLK